MIKNLWWLSLALFLFSCKGKKVSLSGDDEVDISEFIGSFPEVKLPYHLSDTSLPHRGSDSLRISQKIFSNFVPDSVVTALFGKTAKPRFYALGRAREKDGEYYLLVKAEAPRRRMALLLAFSRDRHYAGCLPLIRPLSGYRLTRATLDKKFQISIYREKTKGSQGSPYKREVYIHNASDSDFTLILTEPNEDIIADIYNPIEKLPAHHKYSGDYVRNKKNFVTVRDGRNSGEIQFFVHFDQRNGACTGELRGRARFIKSGLAQYHEAGNPCVLQFSFSSSSVSLAEKGGCGTYRGITCLFEGRFPRMKKTRSQISKKQH